MNQYSSVSSSAVRMLCLLLVTLHGSALARGAEWVKLSNAEAQPVLNLLAKYSPEAAGHYGLDQYDKDVIDLSPNLYERSQADTREVLARLQERLAEEQHPKVKQDMQILIQSLEDSL